jgi:hypothetical protein
LPLLLVVGGAVWVAGIQCTVRHRSYSARMRLRSLSETECYARCYGARDEQVRVVRLEPRRPRYAPRPSGEDLRRHFEERLDQRIEPEAA